MARTYARSDRDRIGAGDDERELDETTEPEREPGTGWEEEDEDDD
jgi:hypothetical protein